MTAVLTGEHVPCSAHQPQQAEVPLQPSPAARLPLPDGRIRGCGGSAPRRYHTARAGHHPTRRNHPARGVSAARVCQCGGGRIAEPRRFAPGWRKKTVQSPSVRHLT